MRRLLLGLAASLAALAQADEVDEARNVLLSERSNLHHLEEEEAALRGAIAARETTSKALRDVLDSREHALEQFAQARHEHSSLTRELVEAVAADTRDLEEIKAFINGVITTLAAPDLDFAAIEAQEKLSKTVKGISTACPTGRARRVVDRMAINTQARLLPAVVAFPDDTKLARLPPTLRPLAAKLTAQRVQLVEAAHSMSASLAQLEAHRGVPEICDAYANLPLIFALGRSLAANSDQIAANRRLLTQVGNLIASTGASLDSTDYAAGIRRFSIGVVGDVLAHLTRSQASEAATAASRAASTLSLLLRQIDDAPLTDANRIALRSRLEQSQDELHDLVRDRLATTTAVRDMVLTRADALAAKLVLASLDPSTDAQDHLNAVLVKAREQLGMTITAPYALPEADRRRLLEIDGTIATLEGELDLALAGSIQ